MSAPASTDATIPKTSSSKKRKNKKKKSNASGKQENQNGTADANGVKEIVDTNEDEREEESADEAESPTKHTSQSPSPRRPSLTQEAPLATDLDSQSPEHRNGIQPPEASTSPASHALAQEPVEEARISDTEERLEALAQERNALREEVTELRKSLETLQQKHSQEIFAIKGDLEETQSQRDHADHQYRTLLGKVNTIKAQLGERLKADAEELSQARSRIDALEEQNRTVRENNESLQLDVAKLASENEQKKQELSDLRSRTNLSQQNWVKERDDLIQREAYAREEFETAKQAMQDWEVLAMEERSVRESLGERVAELEEQLSSQKEAYDRAVSDRDSQSQTVDGLQRALRDIQEARRRELREIVEQSQSQIEDLRKHLQAADSASTEAQNALEAARKELERILPFEKEVKEKNLLIGKLRHEAVILNDHLTKALRFLKKGRPEDNVDRQIVTNHLLHFLTLDRSDPKKFQVLQLIAALLGWTEEQRELAGLVRPGASNFSLKVPLSPFRRAPSTPTLNSEYTAAGEGSSKESLAELWSDFLEREAQEGSASRPRQPSVISPTTTVPPSPGVRSP